MIGSLVSIWLLLGSLSIVITAPSLSRTRILSELREISKERLTLDIPFNSGNDEPGIRLSPLRNNLFEWHFSFTGMEDTAYQGGVYHGVIKLHKDYPRRAPSISLYTPSGRWHINTDICLSASAHHQESWTSDWNLRTLVLSLRAFMTTNPTEIGSMRTSVDERQHWAVQSRDWSCPVCGVRHTNLLDPHCEVRDTALNILRSSSSSSATGGNTMSDHLHTPPSLGAAHVRKPSSRNSKSKSKLSAKHAHVKNKTAIHKLSAWLSKYLRSHKSTITAVGTACAATFLIVQLMNAA